MFTEVCSQPAGVQTLPGVMDLTELQSQASVGGKREEGLASNERERDR